jgi:large subunit ribosomal protein L17e
VTSRLCCPLGSPLLSLSQKTHRRTFRAHGRINPYKGHPTHIEVILTTSDVEVPKAKGVAASKKEKKTVAAIEA